MAASSIPGYQLPAEPETGGRQAQGFVTPTVDRLPQKAAVLPRRVLPIVFLPGIMGSNLRLSAGRQRELGKDNNIAWRPDRAGEALALVSAGAAQRQMQLDPGQTEVDIYSSSAATGNKSESSENRQKNIKVGFTLPQGAGATTPLLMDDPPTSNPRRTKEQKARERGWGEVYFDSYGELLQRCEFWLNSAFQGGQLGGQWKAIVDVEPAVWRAHAGSGLQPLGEAELRQALNNCWFPVHAMGYNWLKSNRQSAIDVAKRIDELIAQYVRCGFQCEKVVVITHSMGGLVARALIHPKIGRQQDKVLGVVHGVMPALGAAAAYRRMRCGTEDGLFNIAAKVLGNYGNEVTAVLGNSPGGLELLPSRAYGCGWLQIVRNGQVLLELPRAAGNPYEEIYKAKSPWYRLLNEAWLNPAGFDSRDSGIDRTFRLLDDAKKFHDDISGIYHPNSYAHYGASNEYAAWHRVVWEIDKDGALGADAEAYRLTSDNRKGRLHVVDPSLVEKSQDALAMLGPGVKLMPPSDPGDQTVPVHSADHQLHSGVFKGVFRQTGYEHQNSYKNEVALHSTIYSLVRIIQEMRWSKE